MEIKSEMIEAIISSHGATSVCPYQFFISWNSVSTLVYRGFSRTLFSIKQKIGEKLTPLKAENPGSRWPKTTLGCLRENVELSNDQVYILRDICVLQNYKLKNIEDPDRSMEIDELNFETFHCRTLEKTLSSQVIPLEGKRMSNDDPPESHLKFVEETLVQFSLSAHNNYYPKLAPKGRTINSYYRKPHIESTLVYYLKTPVALVDIIYAFREEVDVKLPNCYEWFDPNSWHMTVRALVTE